MAKVSRQMGMTMSGRTSWLRMAACSIALGLATAVASPATAQQVRQIKAPGTVASIDLDILNLLLSEQVFASQAEDGIWIMKPGSGRNLVQVPLMIEPGRENTEFGSTTVRLRSARFLAWRVVDPNEQKSETRTSDAAREIESSREDLPTFTRSFVLTPKGRIQWRMDRFLLGGEVKQPSASLGIPDRLYIYKVSPQTLADTAPEAPRLTRNQGEDSMSYYGRQALANNEFRMARERYTELRRQVGELPDELDIDAGRRVWGVFDILLFERNFELTGTDEEPWRISLDMLNTLRACSRAALLPDGTIQPAHIAVMMTVAEDPHPYSQRLVAYTLSLSGAVTNVTFGSELYKLLARMLTGSDSEAKRIVIKEIASVIPPSKATLTLLKNVAAGDLDPRSRIETLKGMLQTDFTQPSTQTRDALVSINQSLNDPEGPDPAQVLDQVLKSSKEQPDSLPVFASGIRFSDMPPQRMQQVIGYVAQNAGTYPLAAQWLDQQFLGAIDPRIVLKTLEIIASADAGGQNLTPVISTGLSRLFGKPPVTQGETASGQIRIDQPIMIGSTNHSIFRALRSSDAKIRQLAWLALPNFVFSTLEEGQVEAPGRNRYDVLMDIALQQSPTPVGAAAFLSTQPQQDLAAAALVQLILRGTSEASALASRYLLNMKIPLETTFTALTFGERAGLASRLYENLQGPPAPLAVNLLRQRSVNNPLVNWFAQQISLGKLPTNRDWASAVSSDATLIELIGSADPDVGMAAVAALAYRVGGTDQDVPRLTRSLRSMSDQSIANLTTEWNKARRGLLFAQFQQITGPYQLLLRMGQEEVLLGVVQFQADNQSISFGNQNISLTVPDDRLAIRLETPNELKSFSQAPELTNLNLDGIPATELSHQRTGEWSGSLAVPNTDPAPQLIMRPMFGR